MLPSPPTREFHFDMPVLMHVAGLASQGNLPVVGGVKALFKAVTFHGVVSPGTIAVAWEGNVGLWKQPSGSIVHHTKVIPSNP